jgi:hypothetical protein
VEAAGSIGPAGPDALFADAPGAARVRRLEGEDGRGIALEARHLRVDPATGRWFLFGLPVPRRHGRVGLLEIECRVLRVSRWRTIDSGPIALSDRTEVAAPPALLGITAESGRCWVSAGYRGEWRDLPAAERLAALLTPVYFSGEARVRDRRGIDLANVGGAGSGGSAACLFVPPGSLEAGRGAGTATVAYPVTVRLRVPEEFAVETAIFRVEDLPLPPAPEPLPGAPR